MTRAFASALIPTDRHLAMTRAFAGALIPTDRHLEMTRAFAGALSKKSSGKLPPVESFEVYIRIRR